jgi:hypothetical protein
VNQPLTIQCDIHFCRHGRGAPRRLKAGAEPQAAVRPVGRVPRVARLLALALRFEPLLREGVLASYRELAELGHVSRVRVSQIMNLLNLAPDLQEAILFLPRTERGRDRIHLRQLQPIASIPDWRKQRRLWAELLKSRSLDTSKPACA